ncbi:type I restriction endonuclease subunit R [Candidatus Sororendozoicomonas aggregata]|uniref:type I restriction endonuclease subunit R n=1 Tax=Candidatus Sororendozoicomonas aggregata TaxID=3073239 RepID=UPI002ED0B632
MPSQTNEQALEIAIEKYLTGTWQEQAKTLGEGQSTPLLTPNHGYQMGWPADFDAQLAMDTGRFWAFLAATQQEELDKLKRRGADWQQVVLARYDKMVQKYGLSRLLKKGLDIDDAHLTLMYPAPLAHSTAVVAERYNANVFSCIRQARYSQSNPLEEIDMVLFINGLPFATLELKNAWTGQTARYHGQKQYRNDRDPHQPLLQFGRCLAHMAVDTDEVYMATKLTGKSTFFLPFNKGHNDGAGNPPNPNGHKSAYLWEDVFSRDSITAIIEHFVRLDGSPRKPLNKRTLFFPRYHQRQVVRKLVKDVSEQGVGKRYLIQHSAGSGKSNSITWAAYQLIEAYPANAKAAGERRPDQPMFDSVIVVTDRRLLDQQIRENIRQFSEVSGLVAPAHNSRQLLEAMEKGSRIIITTIQKFPFIVDSVANLKDNRFAIIIDEAHSSQSGSAHDTMNRAMGNVNAEDDSEPEDTQDKILAAMKSRKLKNNASYFAFTATPKNTTLEKFGVRQSDGTFKPFDLYSMKQAIEEGFILDVLANYTTYKSYYEIEKSIKDNPEFDSKKAQKALRGYVEGSKESIGVKTEVMMDHFLPNIIHAKKLKGKAKGMVVTQNIRAAILYYQAICRYLKDKGNPFKVLIAFSGKATVDGNEYTEADMNGFSETDTREKFAEDEYRLLVVANKYLTGFDQPKLTAMYVDKKLQSVLAVQALSRLNRAAPSLGKKTEDLFILDFFNKAEDIKKAFDPFYTATTLSRATDINVLHDLKAELDVTEVYHWPEVEQFNEWYFASADAQQLSPIIDTAAERFNSALELTDEEKADFKIKAKQFVKIYGQMAAIIPFDMLSWEMLFWFLKFLVPKLIVRDPDQDKIDGLLDSVDLTSYGLERVKLSHSIQLDDSESEVDPQNPNPRGAHSGGDDKETLDTIVDHFNERWFEAWGNTPEEKRVKFLNIANSMKAHEDFARRYQQTQDAHHKELVFTEIFDDVMLDQRAHDMALYRLLAKDEAFKTALKDSVRRLIGG